MAHSMRVSALFGLAACIVASGCTVGPKYQRATALVPAKWDVAEPWRESAPKDGLAKGQWWSAFNDDDLGALEKQSLDANQTIKVAAARLEQARASAAVQIATQFPVLSTTPSTARQRLSGNRPANSNLAVNSAVSQSNNILPFTVGYEVDLFGRRRRSIEAAQASYQASAADLENVRLVITAELAGDYFTLQQLDTELGILNRTVDNLQKGLQLVDSRHKGGVASGLDVAEEETLLNTTRTQAILLQQQRKQFEDAIAVLIGKPAPDFHLSPGELKDEPPKLDAGLPSDLLERRPDVAEAVRDQASQSQQQAVDSARRTLDIASSRYTGGLVNYLDVVNAQQNLLSSEQELAVIHGQRLVTSVLLIKALGGGWDASSLSAVQVKSKLKDVVAP